jgi:hypothetical protein
MTLEEKCAMVEKLVAEIITEASCGDVPCSSCDIGVSLGDGEQSMLPCLDRAFNAGYKLCSDEADKSIGEEN